MPASLPIHEIEERFVAGMRSATRCFLQAPTGSGKSTRVPGFFLDGGLLKDSQEVVILQPRRVAARMLAERVAFERTCQLGEEVGFEVRFQRAVSPKTRLRFVTEGVLLRQLLTDPTLKRVGALVFDEFHERRLYGDTILGLALKLQGKQRPDLKLVMMSATLAQGLVNSCFAPELILKSEGRTFPVELEYLAKPTKDQDIWDLAARAVEKAISHSEGQTLVFMPGAYEIQKTISALRAAGLDRHATVMALHGEMQPEDQDNAVRGGQGRRIIVSTNLAETSLTIPDVDLVVDSGLARQPRYDPHRGINLLYIEKISQASAAQRAGRAGRTRSGRCIRLWTEQEHLQRTAQDLPEVQRLDLSEVLLLLRSFGLEGREDFMWVDAPQRLLWERAEQLLKDLRALGREGKVSDLGREMLELPMHPRLARLVVAARREGCLRQALWVSALAQTRGLWDRQTDRASRQKRDELFMEGQQSDFAAMMMAFQYAKQAKFDARRCRSVGVHAQAARQLSQVDSQLCRQFEKEIEKEVRGEEGALERCLMAAFPDHIASRLDRGTLRCQLTGHRKGMLERDSVASDAPMVVALEITEIMSGKDVEVRLNHVARLEPEWLEEVFPDSVEVNRVVQLEGPSGRVMTRIQTVWRDMVIEQSGWREAEEEVAAKMLSAEVMSGRIQLPAWDKVWEEGASRIEWLAGQCPELDLPKLDENIEQQALQQQLTGCHSRREMETRTFSQPWHSLLSPNQTLDLQRLAPEHLSLPNKRKVKIFYSRSAGPTVAARIQELYGLEASPSLAKGRARLVFEIQGPNRRPLQVTSDLKSFWSESYPVLKKELQRRYPKHEWR
ncbi:MAG: ATP-dependent helicase HrpB [Verrucomicrobiales bacterium]